MNRTGRWLAAALLLAALAAAGLRGAERQKFSLAAAAAILRLRGNGLLTARLCEAAARTGQGYSWRQIATDTATAYAEAIAARDGAAA